MPKKHSNLDSRVSVLEEQERARGEAIKEMSTDVKSVLSSVNALTVALAKLPTWDNLKETNARVDTLENESHSAAGGRKVLVGVAGAVGGLIGWVVSYFSK